MNKRNNHFNASMESIVGVLGMIGGLIALMAAVQIVGKAANKLCDAIGNGISKGTAIAWDKLFPKKNEDPLYIVENTFLNDKWLDKQKFIEGSVSGSGIVGPLSTNGRFDGKVLSVFKKSLDKAGKIDADFWGKYKPVIVKANAAWDKCVQMDNTEAACDALVKMLKPLPLPGSLYSRDLSDILGGLKVIEKRGACEVTENHATGPQSIPALTRDQVKEVGGFLQDYFSSMKKELGANNSFPRPYDYEGNLPGDEEKSDDLWQAFLDEPEADHFSHNYHNDTWGWISYCIEKAHADGVNALMLYVNRSIGK